MSKLSERIAALTGPCREIDAEMYILAYESPRVKLKLTTGYMGVRHISQIETGASWDFDDIALKFTVSPEAIADLTAEVLPSLVIKMLQTKNGWCVQLMKEDEDLAVSNVRHNTEALARCLAFVKAMEANNETDS